MSFAPTPTPAPALQPPSPAGPLTTLTPQRQKLYEANLKSIQADHAFRIKKLVAKYIIPPTNPSQQARLYNANMDAIHSHRHLRIEQLNATQPLSSVNITSEERQAILTARISSIKAEFDHRVDLLKEDFAAGQGRSEKCHAVLMEYMKEEHDLKDAEPKGAEHEEARVGEGFRC
jgi:hypothetical protein